MKRIDVAVGIVVNKEKKVLVGQRVVKDRYFAKWEFPGGKIEAGETVQAALRREFIEETGLIINDSSEFMELKHDYPDRQVKLHIRLVKHTQGTPQALEGQALKWVTLDELFELDFLEGNKSILDKLRTSDL